MDLDEALERLPKVELHCHVEGTMRPETVAELAAKNGRKLPVEDPADLYHYRNLDEFLSAFWLVQECLADPRGLVLTLAAAHDYGLTEMVEISLAGVDAAGSTTTNAVAFEVGCVRRQASWSGRRIRGSLAWPVRGVQGRRVP